MRIREYTESDLDALRALHAAQDFDYAFPDLRNPLFVTKLVLADHAVAQGESLPVRQAGASPAASSGPPPSPDDSGAGNCPVAASVIADKSGRIVGAALLRLTAEAYLLLDPRASTPRERWQWLLALHEAARHDAWQRGLEDVHAWLPPAIAEKFGRRLERLGWRRDDSWTPYCKKL